MVVGCGVFELEVVEEVAGVEQLLVGEPCVGCVAVHHSAAQYVEELLLYVVYEVGLVDLFHAPWYFHVGCVAFVELQCHFALEHGYAECEVYAVGCVVGFYDAGFEVAEYASFYAHGLCGVHAFVVGCECEA